MENQIQNQGDNNQENKFGNFNKRYWKFLGGFLGIIIVVGGGYYIWNNYFSERAKSERETEKNYQLYLDWEKKYTEALKNDVYGGKTPEETLAMFVEALKKGDMELASKYFVLRSDGSIDPKWQEGLQKEKDAGNLNKIINVISKAKYDEGPSWEEAAWFSVANNEGLAEYTIILNFKELSGIWKIESL